MLINRLVLVLRKRASFKKIKFRLVFGFLLALWPLSLFAELLTHDADSYESNSLISSDLLGILRHAAINHPEVLQRVNELEAAGYELDAANWGRFPSLGLSSQALSGRQNATFRLEQPIWTGGKISSQIAISSAGQDQARYALAETQLSYMLDAAQDYFEIVRLQQRLSVAIDNEVEHEKLLNIIKRRVAAEVSPIADETLALSRMTQAQNERVQIERQLAEARNRLQSVLGYSIDTLSTPNKITLSGWNQESLEQAAKQFSPTRKRLQTEVDRAQAEVRLQKAQVMPNVVIGHEQLFGNRDGLDKTQTYLALNMETGAGLSNRSSVRAGSSRRFAALDAIQSHDRELRQQVQSTWVAAEALNQQLIPVQAVVAASEEIVASYLRQFRTGRKSWLDVLNVQREKTQSYYQLADIEMPLQQARLRLLILVGQIALTDVSYYE